MKEKHVPIITVITIMTSGRADEGGQEGPFATKMS